MGQQQILSQQQPDEPDQPLQQQQPDQPLQQQQQDEPDQPQQQPDLQQDRHEPGSNSKSCRNATLYEKFVH